MKKLYILSGLIVLCNITSMAAMEPDRATLFRQFLSAGINGDWKTIFDILSFIKIKNADYKNANYIVNTYRNQYGQTLLCMAAQTVNAPSLVTRLINDFGANPNIPDNRGMYPLSYTVQRVGEQNKPQTVYTLVKLGADPYFKNNGGTDGRGMNLFDYANTFGEINDYLDAIERGLADRNIELEEAEVESED